MNKVPLQKKGDRFFSRYRFLFSILAIHVGIFLCLVVGQSVALGAQDQVAEIAELTTQVTKIAKNGCHIAGCASALIGSVFAVAQQSLKIFGVTAAVTLLAFKAPAFFTSAMLI
jgi:hypothetical protein